MDSRHTMHRLLGAEVNRRTHSKYYTRPGALCRRIALPMAIDTTTGPQGRLPRLAERIELGYASGTQKRLVR
ncbi:MAG: hypothetical protein CMJ58_26865 [Planctomycetaceae bacterium]|nr:hypothetical protein [Planctomycetaceae bacterium]